MNILMDTRSKRWYIFFQIYDYYVTLTVPGGFEFCLRVMIINNK